MTYLYHLYLLQVCYVEQYIDDLSHAMLYKSGCLHKIQCDKHAHSLSLIGRKRYDNTVMSGNDLQIKCCDSNLCNNGNTSTTIGSPVTSGTVVPTHGSQSTNANLCSSNPCIHGNCFSGSNDYFCQCEQGWQGKTCDQRPGKCTTQPCVHGHCFESSIDYACQCENGWEGKNCDVALPPNDCSDLLNRNSVVQSGVYYITTPVSHTKIQVFCDMDTDGGGWTVFQKRFNGRESFHRNFIDYENGFGDVNAEHWLGLKYIQEITSAGSHRLRLDVTHFNRSKGYDVYDNFSLQPGPAYTMNLGARLELSGLQLRYAINVENGCRGCAFSTYDHDVDEDHNQSCAYYFQGGWWYNSCYTVNLNGLYLPGSLNDTAMCFSHDIGLTASTMMFKKK
ncbi:neurogenic locus notch homolog protein 2-like isoform X3 [Dreissena polymorpha]|uniref:neurogenic locus notch homolog protein 2-like isoform X3 n=1 Tax=Dreissena polymorpha TaxID=45954 RepID=UPI00226440DD|nr:neurogenic locus notch homolog protein 2-like isoform X3 [Dreissena polymorpha]